MTKDSKRQKEGGGAHGDVHHVVTPAQDLDSVAPGLTLNAERRGLTTLGVVHAALVRPEVAVDSHLVPGRACKNRVGRISEPFPQAVANNAIPLSSLFFLFFIYNLVY